MDTGLKGKTVLITGASRNMGRVSALMFAREGANLAICTSAKMDELNRVADQARALGGPAAKTMVKLGIVGFTRGLAHEFAEHNITANCIGPGAIARTDLNPGETDRPLEPRRPVTRKGSAEEAVSLMLYLASQNAGYINGQCYLVNGGAYFQ